MKSFVITIMDLPESVACADRCIASAAKFGVETEKFAAITPKNDPIKMMEKLKLPITEFSSDIGSRPENVIAAFLSHFGLWSKCANQKETFLIFEHDAVVIDNLPLYTPFDGCMSLGAPSYGKFQQPSMLGRNPLTSKPYFPGAHAYMLRPHAARILCDVAQGYAMATDVFLQSNLFPFLEEYFPWPVVARDTFTTIQNKTGCEAKHNYKKNPTKYRFFNV